MTWIRTCCCLLLLAVLGAEEGGGDAPAAGLELPAAVTEAMAAYAAGKAEVTATHREALRALDEKLLGALKIEKSRALKAEKLELAVELDQRIKQIEERLKAGTDILGNPVEQPADAVPEAAQPPEQPDEDD